MKIKFSSLKIKFIVKKSHSNCVIEFNMFQIEFAQTSLEFIILFFKSNFGKIVTQIESVQKYSLKLNIFQT